MEYATNFIVDKLKPYLSKIFRNFVADKFAFEISIFSGATLELKDLQFRPTLLQDLGLDLPFELDLLGGIGRIYVELGLVAGLTVTVTDVLVLARGLRRLSYDEKREAAAALERKRAELEALIKKELEAATGGPPPDEEPGFAMKTAMSYVQSAKVALENVHIRFEDGGEGNADGGAYATGAMLKKLAVKDVEEIEEWSHGEATKSTTFYKKGELERLSVYWNSSQAKEQLFGANFDRSGDETATEAAIKEIVVKLKDFVENESENAADINYVLSPVVAEARAMITRHPEKLETPFALPKVHADLQMQVVDVTATDREYNAALALLDTVDQLGRGRKFLEHRPTNPIVPSGTGTGKGKKGNGSARPWWRMAYAIVAKDLARKRENWTWAHIKAHRQLRERYAEAYLRKLTAAEKPDEELLKEVQDLEDQLDNFNVLLARRETEEKNKIRQDLLEKKKAEEKAKSGWGWGWGSSSSDVTVTKEELDKAVADLPEADRKKFVELIDYDPSAPDAHAAPVAYPKDFQEFVVGAVLKGVQGKLVKHKDEERPLEILRFALDGFDLALETHPAVSGLKATASMKTISITGIEDSVGGGAPHIFKSIAPDGAAPVNFIALTFETHPLDSPADQRISYESQPGQLTYDAPTFQKLLEFVTPPPTKIQRVGGKSMFSGFTQASSSKLASLGKNSGTLELDIKINAPTIVVPEGGRLAFGGTVAGDALIGNLGTLTIRAKPRDTSDAALAKVESATDLNADVLAALFNHFEIQLSNFEVLLAQRGEDLARIVARDPTYAAQRPTPIAATERITVDVFQCILGDDVRFPKLKVGVSMPAINLDVVDRRFLRLVHLGLTLPLPKPKSTAGAGGGESTPLVVDETEDPNATYSEALELAVASAAEAPSTVDPEKAPQFTDLVVNVALQEIKLAIAVQDPHTGVRMPLLAYNLHAFAVGLQMKTFGMSLDASIGWMHAEYVGATVPGISGPVYLLYTPIEAKEAFISAHVFSVTGATPKALAGPVKQKVELDIRSVDLILHQDSIQAILSILFGLKKELDSITPKAALAPAPTPMPEAVAAEKPSVGELDRFRRLTRKFSDNSDDVLLKARVTLSRISVKLTSAKAQITQLSILDCEVGFEDKAKTSKMTLELNNLEVLNLEVGSLFPKILTVAEGSKLIAGQVVIHKLDKKAVVTNESALEPQYEIMLAIGGPKLVVLGSYLAAVKNFATNFQAALSAAASYGSEAASAAGEAAAAVGKDLYETDVKFSVDFNLQSPEVVLAKSDGSLEVLYYYFGNIAVKNSLHTQAPGAQDGAPPGIAVFDNLALDVSGVKLVRALLDSDAGRGRPPVAESALLEPLEVHVTLVRNLSRSWFKRAPMFRVAAILPRAEVTVSDDDAIFMASCVFDVLKYVTGKGNGEGDGGPSKAEETIQAKAGEVQAIGPVSSLQLRSAVAVSENPEIADFSLVIQKIGVFLYKGTNPLTGRAGVVPRDASHALGGVYIANLSASGHYYTDGLLDAKLGLNDAALEDNRPEALQSLRQLIVTDPDVDAGLEQVISIGFRMEKDVTSGAQIFSVTLRTRSLKLVLNMDFINAVARYAVSIVDRLPKMDDGKKKAAPVDEEHSGDVQLESGPVSGLNAATAAAAAASANAPLINADVALGEITIVVLENPRSSDTNAVLFTASGFVNVATHSGASRGTASLRFSSFTSRFDLQAPIKRIGEILRPMSIDASLELEPGVKTIVDASTSDITVHFSAGTLHLMSKIIAEFMDAIKSSQQQGDDLEDHSDAWRNKPLDASKYWFLKDSERATATDSGFKPFGAFNLGSPPDRPIESVKLRTGRIFFTLESGVGAMTTPLLFLDTNIEASVIDWSSQLHVVGALKLTLGYNNPYVGAMEYLIEPTGVTGVGGGPGGGYTPWELKLDVRKAAESDSDPGKMTINVTSDKTLDLMVSKSAIEIVQAAVAAFSTAASARATPDSPGSAEAHLQSAPYALRNESGADLTVNVDNTAFLYFVNGEQAPPGDIPVGQGQTVQFGLKSEGDALKHEMVITIPQYKFQSPVLVSNAHSRYYATPLASSTGAPVGVVVDIAISQDYSTHVTVHSLVQVVNELPVAVEVYSMFAPGRVFPAGMAEARGGSVSLPFNAIYERTIGLQFKPRGFGFSPQCYNWTELQHGKKEVTMQQTVGPEGGPGAGETLTFNVVGTALSSVNGNSDQVLPGKNIKIQLRTPFFFRNLLPMPIKIVTPARSQFSVATGRQVPITAVAASAPIGRHASSAAGSHQVYAFTAVLEGYQGQTWTTAFNLTDDPAAPAQGNCVFSQRPPPGATTAYGHKPTQLYFGFERILAAGELTLSLHAAYWIMNYTTLDLVYCNPAGKFVLADPASDESPCMFLSDSPPPPPPTPEQQQKGQTNPTRLCINVQNGGWSQAVAVDTVGASVLAVCPKAAARGGAHPYEFSVSVELAGGGNTATKVVTISPRYTITNACRFPVTWLDANAGGKFDIPAASTIPFWPHTAADKLLPVLAVGGTEEYTATVPIQERAGDQFFLPFSDGGSRYGGLGVSVSSQAQDTKTVIQIHEFNAAEIPLLFVNDLDGVRFELWEDDPLGQYAIGPPERKTLDAKSRLCHAWKNPLLANEGRAMNWRIADAGFGPGQEFRVDASMDASGDTGVGSRTTSTEFTAPDGRPCVCFSFTEGLQRVLFFTDATSTFPALEHAKKTREAAATMQVNFSLGALSLSLVDNIAPRDVLYGRVTGLSGAYAAYPLGFAATVNVHDLRLDNMDREATYPVILVQTRPGGAGSQHPFLSLHASVARATPKSAVKFISGSVDLQEVRLEGDMALVGNVMELFTPGAHAEASAAAEMDYSAALQSVSEFYNAQTLLAGAVSAGREDKDSKKPAGEREPVHYFRDLSIGNTKINVSFSMAGIDSLRERLSGSAAVGAMLGMIGSFRVGVSNVNVDLAGKHYVAHRATMPELIADLTAHYKEQGMNAVYHNLIGAMLGSSVALVGHTLGGLVNTAGGLLGEVGHITDALHVPLLGGLFGGVSHALDDTAKGINKSADGGSAMASRMRAPRELRVGVAITPYVAMAMAQAQAAAHAQQTQQGSRPGHGQFSQFSEFGQTQPHRQGGLGLFGAPPPAGGKGGFRLF